MADIIDVIMRITDMVTPSLDDIQRHLIDTRNQHRHLASEVRGVSRSLGSMADAMAPVAMASAAVGAVGVKSFMDFDATITAAGVKAGATAEEVEQMRDVAGKLGAEFPISAQDAAAGMDRLAAGGFDAQQAMGALPAIIEASVASGEDLAATSDVVTSALDIWNMRTGDVAANSTHVADVIQATANASKMGMQEFGLAMQYAGAPAATLGVSIEELGTAMGVMANNGIEASTIGTSLRSVFSRLADPPKTTAMAFDQLGISVADLQNGDGSFIGLSGAVDLLRDKMDGLSDTQQVAIAKAIAGEDAYSGLLALIRTSPEAYAQVADAINNSAGSSHAAFEKMNNTLKGSIDQLKGAAESAAISIGQALAPQLRGLADIGTAAATAIANMTPAQKAFLLYVGEGIIGLTGLLLVSSKTLGIAATMIQVYGDVGKVLAGQTIRNRALQYAVIGVQRAFGTMRAGAVALRTAVLGLGASQNAASLMTVAGWSRARAAVAASMASMRAQAAASMASMRASVAAAAGTVTSRVSAMAASVRASTAAAAQTMTWANFRASVSAHMTAAGAAVTSARTSIVASFATMRASATASMASMRASVVASVGAMQARLRAMAASARAAGAASLAMARSFSITGAASAAANALSMITKNALAATVSMVRLVAAFSVSAALGTAARAFRLVATAIGTATKASLAFALSPVGLAIIAIAGTAYLLYTNWSRIAPLFQRLALIIRAGFTAALTSVQPAIRRLEAAWNRLMAVFQQHSATFAMIGNVLQVLATIVGGVVVGAVYVLASVLTGVLTAAFNVVAAVVEMGIGVFTGIIDFITGVFTGNWSAAWQGIVEIFSSIFGGIKGIAEGILDGVKAAINAVIGGINSISVTVPDWVPGLGGKSFGPLGIPYLANGTENWGGGPAIINERGAEIVDLPSGSRVIPHDQSLKQAYQQGARSGGAKGGTAINVYITGATINNGGDIKKIAYEVAKEIDYQVEKRAINLNVGAI